MIITSQKTTVKWHYSNKEHFTSFGYSFSKYGDEISVNVFELMSGSKVKIDVQCDYCDDIFKQRYNVVINRNKHFCNRKCYENYLSSNGSPNNTRVKINCSYCDKEIEVKNYRYENLINGNQESICCSRDCQNKLIGEKNRGVNSPNYKGNIKKSCEICNETFEVAQNRKESAKYCSVKCQRIGVGKQNIPKKLRNVTCDNCCKPIQKWEHILNRYEFHFCSNKCRLKYQGYFVSKQQNKIEDTACQKEVNNLLQKLGVSYENEKPFNYYAVDNYLTNNNLIIEVMGDYWHSNPNVYPNYADLNEMQLKRVKTDKSKFTYLKDKYGINVLYLWEHDINKNIDLCEKLIIEYIETNGILKNFNSFNYSINNGELELKQKIIHPHFLVANTKRQRSIV